MRVPAVEIFRLPGPPDPVNSNSLRVEYLVRRGYPAVEFEICGAPTQRSGDPGCSGGPLVAGGNPVTTFTANHTMKRAIMDRRL